MPVRQIEVIDIQHDFTRPTPSKNPIIRFLRFLYKCIVTWQMRKIAKESAQAMKNRSKQASDSSSNSFFS